ncbi:MAG: biotin--[acetyl-CoA-carboxylase] ligase [Pelagibacterales bacterium]|nr:biotin--[acetyl-CoA-carboxylase] ligase [Pelagibacterales bacterium]
MKLKRFNFKIVNSTNNLAHKIILHSKNKLGIVSAEKQVKGRGQYGKTWVSPKGNLYVSVFFPIDNKHFDLKKFTFINCLLVKKTISSFYKGTIKIKKPNDLLIDNKKVSGILQETLLKLDQKFIIIGIGVNLIKNPNLTNYPTTNLLDLTNSKITVNNVRRKLIKIYEKYIPMIQKNNIKKIYSILK